MHEIAKLFTPVRRARLSIWQCCPLGHIARKGGQMATQRARHRLEEVVKSTVPPYRYRSGERGAYSDG